MSAPVSHVHRRQRLRDRDGVGRRARVPVGEHPVRVRSDDRHARAGSQREDSVVLQHDHRAGRRLAGQRTARGQVEVGCRDGCPRVEVGVELAGGQAELELTQCGSVDVGLVQQPALECRGEVREGAAGVVVVVGERVDARAHGRRGGVDGVGVVPLGGDQVGGGAGVRDHEQGRGRPPADLVEELPGDVVRAPVHQVVRGHHGADDPGLDRPAERCQLVLVQHARGHLCVGDAAVRLVPVGDQVLERGHGAPVQGVVATQSAGVRGGEVRGQVRVLGEPLLVPAPARVPQRVDHRRPHVQGDRAVGRVLGADLGADDGADACQQLGVPRGSQADRLGEGGRRPEPGHSVQRLGPGPERPEPDARDRPGVLVQEGEPLCGSEPVEQLPGARGERSGGRCVLGHGSSSWSGSKRLGRRTSNRFDDVLRGGRPGGCRIHGA